MPLKLELHEKCLVCGKKKIKYVDDDYVWWRPCDCDIAVPGPKQPPIRYRKNEVIIIHDKIVAWWSVSLDVDCPKCDNYFDFLETQEGREVEQLLIESADNVDLEAKCPDCGHEFIIKEIIL